MVTLPDCSICCEPLAANLGSLKCGHVFHSECILQWLAERSVCPLCKQSVHRSHIRNLFYTAGSGSGSQSLQAIPVSHADSNVNDAEIKQLMANLSEYRSKLSKCQDLLSEKDRTISELHGKIRVLEQDQNRRTADVQSLRIKIESLKKEKQNLVTEYENHLGILERKVADLQAEEAIKKAVEEQNKNGIGDIAAIKRRCKAMSLDIKIKFLFQQLEYINDLCAQLQQRNKTLEKDLKQSRLELATMQAMDRAPQSGNLHNRQKRDRRSRECSELIILDGSDDSVDENIEMEALPSSSLSKTALPKPPLNPSSLRISTGNSQSSVSVSLIKPNPAKRPSANGIAGLSYLSANRPGRGSTGTGCTSSTFSRIASISKDRFRSNISVSSSATSQDIRAHFKRKQPGI